MFISLTSMSRYDVLIHYSLNSTILESLNVYLIKLVASLSHVHAEWIFRLSVASCNLLWSFEIVFSIVSILNRNVLKFFTCSCDLYSIYSFGSFIIIPYSSALSHVAISSSKSVYWNHQNLRVLWLKTNKSLRYVSCFSRWIMFIGLYYRYLVWMQEPLIMSAILYRGSRKSDSWLKGRSTCGWETHLRWQLLQ